jgi:hypothetical protein
MLGREPVTRGDAFIEVTHDDGPPFASAARAIGAVGSVWS